MTPVQRSTFYIIWSTFCSDIVVQKPRTDLCNTCQENYKKHSEMRGATEEEKSAFFEECKDHLERVHIECAYYHTMIAETRNSFNLDRFNVPHPVLSYPNAVHLSFDFAQQVNIIFFKQTTLTVIVISSFLF